MPGRRHRLPCRDHHFLPHLLYTSSTRALAIKGLAKKAADEKAAREEKARRNALWAAEQKVSHTNPWPHKHTWPCKFT